MSNSKFLSAVLLAAPAALFTAGCSGGEATSSQNTSQGATAPAQVDEHAGHNHAPGEGHGQDADAKNDHASGDGDGHDHGADDGHEHAPAAKTTVTPAPATKVAPVVDEHAGHDHAEGEGHEHEAINNPPALGDGTGARLMYKVGSETHDFDRVMQGTVAEHTFDLTNDGTEDLIIKQVKPTCGCTVAQVKVQNEEGEWLSYVFGEAIPPGSKLSVPAKLHTKNKSGHQTTRINIFSNDPRGTIQLGLEADIDPFFNIAPRFLQFGQISVGDVIEKRAVVSTTKGTPVMLALVDQSLPAGADCKLLPVNPDAEGKAARWDLSVTLGPDLTEGSLARAISITSDVEIPGGDAEVDGPAKYNATVTLSASVVGPFSYNPPYLSMGLVRPGQVATRTVTIECHDSEFSFADHMPKVHVYGLQNAPTDATSAASYREWEYANVFTPTVRPVEGKNAVEVQLQLEGMPDDATGSFRGTLVIELGHKDKKDIALVVTGVCRGGPAKK